MMIIKLILLIFLVTIIQTNSQECKTYPIAVSNFTTCENNICKAKVHSIVKLPLNSEATSCIDVKFEGKLLKTVKLGLHKAYRKYPLDFLYYTGRFIVSSDSFCNCPDLAGISLHQLGCPSCNNSQNKTHLCISKKDVGYNNKGSVIPIDIISGIGHLLQGDCWQVGVAPYCTTYDFAFKNEVKVLKSREPINDLILFEDTNNETRKYIKITDQDEYDIGEGFKLHKTLIEHSKYDLASGFILVNTHDPHKLYFSKHVNDKNFFNPEKLGWFQLQGGKYIYDSNLISAQIKTDLSDCSKNVVFSKTNLQNFNPNELDTIDSIFSRDYLYSDPNSARVSDHINNLKYQTYKSIPSNDRLLNEFYQHADTILVAHLNTVLELGYTLDCKFTAEDVNNKQNLHTNYLEIVKGCKIYNNQVETFNYYLYRKSINNKCLVGGSTVHYELQDLNTTIVKELFSTKLLDNVGKCSEFTFSLEDMKEGSTVEADSSISFHYDSDDTILLDIVGEVSTISFQSNSLKPKILSCFFEKNKLGLEAKSLEGIGEALLMSNDSSILHSKYIKLTNTAEIFNFTISLHSNPEKLKVGLCYKDICDYCSGYSGSFESSERYHPIDDFFSKAKSTLNPFSLISGSFIENSTIYYIVFIIVIIFIVILLLAIVLEFLTYYLNIFFWPLIRIWKFLYLAYCRIFGKSKLEGKIKVI